MPQSFTVIITALLSGCAGAPPPPLTEASPASPDAPGGARGGGHKHGAMS